MIIEHCTDLGAQMLGEQGNTVILQAISANLSTYG